MLRRRVDRVESWLRREEATARRAARQAATQAAALRALLAQLQEADPFPREAGADFLQVFWPWLLAGAGRWPAGAVDYALALGGLTAAVARLARRGSPP